jgi:DNA-binding transcriptional MerR regulator
MGMVVDLTGRSEKTIRGWEDSGLIPKPTVDGKHRYYTHKQLGLLVQFSAFLEEVRYDRALRQAKVNVKSQELYAQWES